MDILSGGEQAGSSAAYLYRLGSTSGFRMSY